MLAAPAEPRRSRRLFSRRWKRRFRKPRAGKIQKEDGMRKIFGWTAVAVLAGGVLGSLTAITGCKSNEVKQSTEGNATPAAPAPLDPATLGTVSGTIRFQGKAPAPVKIDMSMDPVCSMRAADNFAEQYAVNDGKLANVYVYIKSGPPAAMSATRPASSPV